MASDEHAAEAVVVRRLRQWTVFAMLLGAVAIALGYVDVVVIDQHDYEEHVVRASSDALNLIVIAALIPAGWVYSRPRWPQIVLWIMWSSSCAVISAALVLGREVHEWESPGAIRPVIALALGMGLLIVIVALPVVRSRHNSPPKPAKLPRATIVKDGSL